MEGHNDNLIKFNVLLDTASSRSYISEEIKNKLNINSYRLRSVVYDIRTFLSCCVKELKETSVTVYLPSGRHHVMPILIDQDFNITLNVLNLNTAIKNFKHENLKLAANLNVLNLNTAVKNVKHANLKLAANFRK